MCSVGKCCIWTDQQGSETLALQEFREIFLTLHGGGLSLIFFLFIIGIVLVEFPVALASFVRSQKYWKINTESCICFNNRPDMTFDIDWALRNNYLFIYVLIDFIRVS